MKQIFNKVLFTFLISILFFGISYGNIVFPWRATKTIVKPGDTFPILYDNLKASKIDEVILQGPFNKVILLVDSVSFGRFEYDSFTQNSVNNKIWVTIPLGTPEELYDLIVKSAGEKVTSQKSVKVVKEFSQKHYFIHISDTHVSRQWIGTAENGYAKELELLDRFIDVANIIAPDFVIVTGDIIHHYTRFNADETGWGGDKVYEASIRPVVEEKFRNYYEGANGFRGVHGLNAPVFSLPGNHDTYGVPRNNNMVMASQWNKMCGMRVYGFVYGDTRIIAADDFLGDPVNDIPDKSPMSGLQGKFFENFFKKYGTGKVQIMAQHRPDRIDTTFVDKYGIDVLLNGHSHNPYYEYVGKTPTLSIRSGAVCRSGEMEAWKENLGFFRLFSVENGKVDFSPALRFCKNPTGPYHELELNLTLDYRNTNDGTRTSNKAVINNQFNINLPKCKVRFVMKKGNYIVEGGKINQVIQTEELTVVDVYTKVDANSEKPISIYQQ